MIQNSLSPVVKSRISSFSGSTIRVEKRSLARTGMICSREYFTVRAPSAGAAKDGGIAVKRHTARATKTAEDCLRSGERFSSLFFSEKVRCYYGTGIPGTRLIRSSAKRKWVQDHTGTAKREIIVAAIHGRARRQHFEPLLESIGVEGFFALAVVVGVVGVEPIALRDRREVRDLREFRGLDEELLLGDEA